MLINSSILSIPSLELHINVLILDGIIFIYLETSEHSIKLEYLTLSRQAGTLSGGESQRIRLATQIGSGLVGVLYILDEPSIGLHQRDNDKLLSTMFKLRDMGNTLIVVEHDEDTIREADFIVDIDFHIMEEGNITAYIHELKMNSTSLVESAVPTADAKVVETGFNMIASMVIPSLNNYLAKFLNITIPSVKGIKFDDMTVNHNVNYMAVEYNLTYENVTTFCSNFKRISK